MVDLDLVASRAVEASLHVRRGERVWIQGWDHTTDIVSRLAWQCRKRNAHVLVTLQPEDVWLRSLIDTPLELLEHLSPAQAAALAETDVYIFTLGPKRPIQWSQIPEERRKAASVWLDPRYDRSPFAREWSALSRRHEVRALGLEATLATRERAEGMHLDFERWRDVMYAGCVADWREVAAKASALVPVLSGDEEAHVTTPWGTDLRFSLDRREVAVSDGLATVERAQKGIVTFLPAGGVEVSVAEDSAEGTVVYDVPIHAGTEVVEGVALRVVRGRIVEFSAKSKEQIFAGYLSAKGDAERFASFGVGLNPNLRFGYTQDDKVLGGVTVGFGDNENKGGRNRALGREWWGAMSKATVSVGRETIVRDGQLVI